MAGETRSWAWSQLWNIKIAHRAGVESLRPDKFDPEPVVALREHDANIGKVVQKNHDMMMEMWNRLEVHPDFPRQYLPNLRYLRAR